MNSRERLLTVLSLGKPDHVPLICWCFGYTPPASLRWQKRGRDMAHWYTGRLEFIHTLPEPWTLEDDFERVKRWLSLGLDDVLDISPPWGVHPDVTWRDWQQAPTADEPHTLLCREYQTPAGSLRHTVRRSDEATPPGWVIQPPDVPLFEDFNIPRCVRHAVTGPEDLPKLRYLLQEPNHEQLAIYREKMARVTRFAREQSVLVQGWSAFGMDGVIWLTGVERAVLAAMTEPDFFEELLAIMAAFDRRRTEVMLDVGGIDLVVMRGWYSSTDFWSPTLFQSLMLPRIREISALAYQAGVRFAYTMTTGVARLADSLLQGGIDLLYYIDPVQDQLDLAAIRDKLGGKMALAGGINSGVTLASGSAEEIREAVQRAVTTLGPGGGFILSPVDALFPDTPWASVEAMIAAWREVCGAV
ncbi:MAG: uroporphyrinogen decarboxylase family protein [Anaerolineae bacterium]